MNTGWPPTARNARTGLFTPPGMTFSARSKRESDLESLMEGGVYSLVRPRSSRSSKRNESRVPLEARKRRILPQLLRMRDLPIHCLLQLRKRAHDVILL